MISVHVIHTKADNSSYKQQQLQMSSTNVWKAHVTNNQ